MYQNSNHQFVERKGGRGYFEWTESRLLVQVQLKVFLTTKRRNQGGRLIILNNTFIKVKLM